VVYADLGTPAGVGVASRVANLWATLGDIVLTLCGERLRPDGAKVRAPGP
jgi:hypothetical protein